MTLQEIATILGAEVHSGVGNLSRVVQSGFASDLLSEVMAGAEEGQLWFTVQIHPNVAVVALLTSLAAVIITGGHKPDPVTIAKAENEGLIIMSTEYSTFTAIHSLSQKGL